MGAAYYPVFEKQVKGFDPATAVSGKSLAKVMEVLDECARQIGVQIVQDEAFFVEPKLEDQTARTVVQEVAA